MSRMSYNSHGDLLNGKPPAMAGISKDYYRSSGAGRSVAPAAQQPILPPARCSIMGSRPTLVPDLVVEYSRHHHHHHQSQHHQHNHEYVMKPSASRLLLCMAYRTSLIKAFFCGGSDGIAGSAQCAPRGQSFHRVFTQERHGRHER